MTVGFGKALEFSRLIIFASSGVPWPSAFDFVVTSDNRYLVDLNNVVLHVESAINEEDVEAPEEAV